MSNRERAAAAELALKAYIAASTPGCLSSTTNGPTMVQEILEAVDLTEAPEDAVCSLVIDLMDYCEREKIKWADDVLSRAQERFYGKRRSKIQK